MEVKEWNVVLLRNGLKYVRKGDLLINKGCSVPFKMEKELGCGYDSSLNNLHHKNLDIVKVYESDAKSLDSLLEDRFLRTLWIR